MELRKVTTIVGLGWGVCGAEAGIWDLTTIITGVLPSATVNSSFKQV